MPGFDGTGPRGEGPFTGGGRGYCAMTMPPAPGTRPYGYAGLHGIPFGAMRPAAGWPAPYGRGPGGGRGRAMRGRGRRGRGRW